MILLLPTGDILDTERFKTIELLRESELLLYL